MKRRTEKDFRVPGHHRFSNKNTRADAEWVEVACTRKETDEIMGAIGVASNLYHDKEVPSGKILARICRE
jgi:hypothetical protein